MKNIMDICKDFGVEIPADRQAEFGKAVAENYKTVSEVEKKLGKLESERDTWKEKAETAETTLKGFEGIDPAKIQAELDTWKQKAADAEKAAQAQIYERDFSDALKGELESVRFTSEAAKRDVMAQIKAAELKLKDGKILGLTDLIGQIKKSDASAFVDEQQEQLEANKARFTAPMKPGTGGTSGLTKADIMGIKDPSERQSAIAKNIGLFTKGE